MAAILFLFATQNDVISTFFTTRLLAEAEDASRFDDKCSLNRYNQFQPRILKLAETVIDNL